MSATWTKAETIGLSRKLREVAQGLREIIPQLVEQQVRAMEGMARTLAASRGLGCSGLSAGESMQTSPQDQAPEPQRIEP